MNNAVAALDRITLNEILNDQALRTLRYLHHGSVGVIAERLLFARMSRKPPTRNDRALTIVERIEFYRAWCRAINRLSRELAQRYVSEDGTIDWQRLIKGDVISA
ncbi:MAG: hypothetical protein DMF37_03450 [Verrucomicrobia bacterium]|nr:MAG: hypothetical protein DMF37_03450 [Verrucomicrobiota bacterium]